MQQMAVFWELLALKFFMKAPLKYNKSPLLGAFPAASLRRSYLPSRQISCASFRSGSRRCASGAPGQTRQRGVMISPLIHSTDLASLCFDMPPPPSRSVWMDVSTPGWAGHPHANEQTHTHTQICTDTHSHEAVGGDEVKVEVDDAHFQLLCVVALESASTSDIRGITAVMVEVSVAVCRLTFEQFIKQETPGALMRRPAEAEPL